MDRTTPARWEPVVVLSLRKLGNTAHLSDLYREVKRVAPSMGRPITTHFQAKVRQVCQKSKRIAHGDAPGIWRLVG